MTNEKALDVFARVEKCAEDDCPTGISCNICPYNVTEKEYNEAYDLALNALSNQCASIGQADMSRDDVPDTNVGSIRFKPGDKFILELGQERKMFGEFEIAGTDLYVETSLLEKLKRYEPEVKTEKIPYKKPEVICCKDCKYSELGKYGALCCAVKQMHKHPDSTCSYAERRNDG